jgi:phosphate/phosphite/phosphonate ABC transporter binding protein
MIVMSAVILVAGVLARNACADLKLGLTPRLNASQMLEMFSPLAEYLSKETGEKVILVIPKDFDTFKEMVLTGQVDLAFANPLHYIQLKEADPSLEPLAISAEKDGTKFRGIVMVRKDSGIEKITDLKGKRISSVEKTATVGYLFQMLTIHKAGLDVHKDIISLPFAKKHSNVAMAVFNRAADAGCIRENDLPKMKDFIDVSQVRIIGYTDYVPQWPLISTKQVSKETAEKIKIGLLKLKPNSAEAQPVVGAAKLTGFAPVSDKDYDDFRQAVKVANDLGL